MKVKAKRGIVQYLAEDETICIPKGTLGELQPFVAAFIGLVPVIFEHYGYVTTDISNLEFIKDENES